MFKVIKKAGKRVKAYRLGEQNAELDRLVREGKIVPLDSGEYELFSEEAIKGGSGRGEIARAGDYVKLSESGYPYPNSAEFFENNHALVSGDEYVQIPRPLDAWDITQPSCEIQPLVDCGRLRLNPSDPERYFEAVLWGTCEAAPRDSVIVFQSITRDADGRITAADFNFIIRSEFKIFYDLY